LGTPNGRGRVTESLVIVVSILIAFFLDAWWERQVERRDLLDDLVNVSQEIEPNLSALDLHLLFQRTASASILELATRSDEVGAKDLIEVPDTIVLSAMVFVPSYDPSTGAVDALIASGQLSQLENDDLKRILTEFRTEVEDIREDELGARAIAHEYLLPLFWDDDGLTPALGRSNEYHARGLTEVTLPTVPVQLRNIPELKNILMLRFAWIDSAIRELDLLRADLVRASDLLVVETGGT
jgi:hypothetical protein